MLTALVVYQVVTLRRKLKAGVFGAKLTLRLVLLFALMAVLPGALIYGMSVQFLARSIESWFEVRVDKALEGGLNLGPQRARQHAEGSRTRKPTRWRSRSRRARPRSTSRR